MVRYQILLKGILKFIIITSILQGVVWMILFLHGMAVISEAMDLLSGKVAEANCIDAYTGEYGDMTAFLIRSNLEDAFFKYPVNVGSFQRVSTHGSDLYKIVVQDGSYGNDSFTVKKADGTGAYSFATAAQKYEPLTIAVSGYLYLPVFVYMGRVFDEHTILQNDMDMAVTTMPGNPKQLAFAIKFTRQEVVIGTRYYKGLALGGTI